jgi:hypothetical protein
LGSGYRSEFDWTNASWSILFLGLLFRKPAVAGASAMAAPGADALKAWRERQPDIPSTMMQLRAFVPDKGRTLIARDSARER